MELLQNYRRKSPFSYGNGISTSLRAEKSDNYHFIKEVEIPHLEINVTLLKITVLKDLNLFK
jgi:hypothetical protein